jgi:hypothetical protein
MPDQNPTPHAQTPHDPGDTEARIVSFPWPRKLGVSSGACFTFAFTIGGTIASGHIDDPTRAWQLVILAVASMTCGAALAITQRPRQH